MSTIRPGNLVSRSNWLVGAFLLACLACANSYGQAQSPVVTIVKPEVSEMWTANLPVSEKELLAKVPANFHYFGASTVGGISNVQRFTVEFAAAATFTKITAPPDFKLEPESSCAEGGFYHAQSSCALVVSFVPQGAGHRLGKISITHDQSTAPVSMMLGGFGYAPVLSFVPSLIGTVPKTVSAGVGVMSHAQNIAIAGDTLLIADTGNNLIRSIDSSGAMITLASGYTAPWGVAEDAFGQVYFSLPSANALYEVYDYGPVVQINGSGTGACPVATPCNLNSHAVVNPGSLAITPSNLMFFPEQGSGAAMSQVQPLPATFVQLYDPFPYQTNPTSAFAADAYNNLYSLWTTSGNCQIVSQTLYDAEHSNVNFNKVAGGHTCGFSGDGGLAQNAEIGNLIGQMTFDIAGNLYFSDTKNNRIRRIDAATGIIRTIAGNGVAGYTGDGGRATSAALATPTGVAVDSQGQVYILAGSAATGTAQVVRKVGATGEVVFASTVLNKSSAAGTVNVANTGNYPLTLTTAVVTGANASDFAVDPNTTSCNLAPGGTLYNGQSCQIGIIFKPSGVGSRSASLTLLDNTVTNRNSVRLTGNGVAAAAVKFISPLANASFGVSTSVKVKVQVISSNTTIPTGTVTFKVDGVQAGSAVKLVSGAGSTILSGFKAGSHTLYVAYGGDKYNSAAHATETIAIATAALASNIER